MKTIRIIQLILLILLTVVLMGTLFAFVTGRFSFGMQFSQISGPSVEIYDLTYAEEAINNLVVDINVANINFETSDTNEFRVVYFAPESEEEEPNVLTTLNNGRLEIHEERPSRFVFTNALTESRSLTVYVPDGFEGVLDCSVVSGSIRINRDFDVSKALLKSTSGSIRLQNIIADEIVISNTSGSFYAERLEAHKIDVLLVSGSINIEEYFGKGEIKTLSGAISVDHYSGAGSINSTSGSIRLGLDEMNNNLNISSTSGSINVTILNPNLSAHCDFSTTSGNISTSFAEPERQVVGATLNHSLGGSPEYQWSINVTSGNIQVS